MRLKIDHVAIAASRLEPLQKAFAEVGLKTDYGGPHSNGITHMSLLGLDDGSYIELISSLEPGQISPWWHEHISDDGGPCAWAIEVDDVAAEVQRVAALGIPVHGPTYYHRDRPDGTRIEWDLAIIGDQGMGALLPFILKDRTPRHYRVSASTSVAGSELTGVALVVLGVNDIDAAADLFRRLYDLPAPQFIESPGFGATLARFAGQPFALATPLGSNDWLRERLARFGDTPCACLIATRNAAASTKRFNLHLGEPCFGQEVWWFASPTLNRLRIGVTAC